jgi:hypothetical protein
MMDQIMTDHVMIRSQLINNIRERTFFWWEGSAAWDGTPSFLSLVGRRTYDYEFHPDEWDRSWFEEMLEWTELADILLDS